MVSTADSSANHLSPRPELSTCDGAAANRRTTPWAKVVRGDLESSLSAATHQSPPSSSSSPATVGASSTPEKNPSPNSNSNSNSSPSKAARSSPPPADVSLAAESSNGQNGNADRPKKPAWNKPSNDVAEPVMGAVAWPPLSASPKLPADSSFKTVPDVSVPVSQVPVITPTPNSKKHTSNHANPNPNSAPNHTLQGRPRPTKRGGGSSTGVVHPGFAHPPPPPPPPPFPVIPIIPAGYGNNMLPAMADPSPRDPSFRGNNWEPRTVGFAPQPHQVNDHRHSSRRPNFNPHSRGDGPYNNNYVGKRDHQDRGSFMSGRDVQMHHPRAPPPRGLVSTAPTPPSTVSFTSQPARPFAGPIAFPDFLYMPTMPLDPMRGMPFMSHAPHPMYLPVPVAEPPLPSLIVNQIDYYFSDTNLVGDKFLRSNMDAQGWVPISLIANFPRVRNLSTNVQFILDCLRASSNVEVQDEKVRRRNDWTKWISTTVQLPAESGTSPHGVQSPNMLSTSFQKMTVGDVSPTQSSLADKSDANSMDIPESCSTDSTGESQLPNGEITENHD